MKFVKRKGFLNFLLRIKAHFEWPAIRRKYRGMSIAECRKDINEWLLTRGYEEAAK